MIHFYFNGMYVVILYVINTDSEARVLCEYAKTKYSYV